MIDPAAYLHDIINDPGQADMPKVHQAIIRLTGRIRDPSMAADMMRRLDAAILALVDACKAEAPSDAALFSIGGKQLVARALLGQAADRNPR